MKTFMEYNLFNKLNLYRIFKEKVEEEYYIKVHTFYLPTGNNDHANFIVSGLLPVTIINVTGNSQ